MPLVLSQQILQRQKVKKPGEPINEAYFKQYSGSASVGMIIFKQRLKHREKKIREGKWKRGGGSFVRGVSELARHLWPAVTCVEPVVLK